MASANHINKCGFQLEFDQTTWIEFQWNEFFPAQILGESFAAIHEVTMGISQRTQLLVFFICAPNISVGVCWIKNLCCEMGEIKPTIDIAGEYNRGSFKCNTMYTYSGTI